MPREVVRVMHSPLELGTSASTATHLCPVAEPLANLAVCFRSRRSSFSFILLLFITLLLSVINVFKLLGSSRNTAGISHCSLVRLPFADISCARSTEDRDLGQRTNKHKRTIRQLLRRRILKTVFNGTEVLLSEANISTKSRYRLACQNLLIRHDDFHQAGAGSGAVLRLSVLRPT